MTGSIKLDHELFPIAVVEACFSIIFYIISKNSLLGNGINENRLWTRSNEVVSDYDFNPQPANHNNSAICKQLRSELDAA